ncbi:hypothetical protein A2G94_04630 [Francisella endosymbiont of Ornithodoros moubata]|nr:hypothetical protein A2G94_04630 [Francisella endosymbiont of Ornithodoros moubata]
MYENEQAFRKIRINQSVFKDCSYRNQATELFSFKSSVPFARAHVLSDEIVTPRSVTCCGFAGDKSFTFPELNASALSGLKEEVKDCVCGISNSRTREIGLSYHSGLIYYSAFDLLDKHPAVKLGLRNKYE